MDAIKFSDKALSVFPMAFYFSAVKGASARRSAGWSGSRGCGMSTATWRKSTCNTSRAANAEGCEHR